MLQRMNVHELNISMEIQGEFRQIKPALCAFCVVKRSLHRETDD